MCRQPVRRDAIPTRLQGAGVVGRVVVVLITDVPFRVVVHYVVLDDVTRGARAPAVRLRDTRSVVTQILVAVHAPVPAVSAVVDRVVVNPIQIPAAGSVGRARAGTGVVSAGGIFEGQP